MGCPRVPRRKALAEPPPAGTRNARSALHSTKDVKSGHACRVSSAVSRRSAASQDADHDLNDSYWYI